MRLITTSFLNSGHIASQKSWWPVKACEIWKYVYNASYSECLLCGSLIYQEPGELYISFVLPGPTYRPIIVFDRIYYGFGGAPHAMHG